MPKEHFENEENAVQQIIALHGGELQLGVEQLLNKNEQMREEFSQTISAISFGYTWSVGEFLGARR